MGLSRPKLSDDTYSRMDRIESIDASDRHCIIRPCLGKAESGRNLVGIQICSTEHLRVRHRFLRCASSASVDAKAQGDRMRPSVAHAEVKVVAFDFDETLSLRLGAAVDLVG